MLNLHWICHVRVWDVLRVFGPLLAEVFVPVGRDDAVVPVHADAGVGAKVVELEQGVLLLAFPGGICLCSIKHQKRLH